MIQNKALLGCFKIFLTVGIAIFSLGCYAIETLTEDENAQIKSYKNALMHIKLNDTKHGKQYLLHAHPLTPYLHYAYLSKNLSTVSEESILQFIKQHSETPLAKKLVERWLQQLVRQQEWETFIKHYQLSDHIGLHCSYLLATKTTDFNLPALQKIESCQHLFLVQMKSQNFNSDLIWVHVESAIRTDNLTQAETLIVHLDHKKRQQAKLWVKFMRNPYLLLSANFNDPVLAQKIISTVIIKLIKQKPKIAANYWKKIQGEFAFNKSTVQKIHYAFALHHAVALHPDTKRWMGKVDDSMFDEKLRAWQIRYVLFHKKWKEVIRLIHSLPHHEKNEAIWRYWLAHAFSQSQQSIKADEIFRELANEYHYYALLAAKRLQQAFPKPHIDSNIPHEKLRTLAEKPAIKRAKLLYFAQDYTNARREWRFAIDKMNSQNKLLAAYLAAQWGWHEKAIQTAESLQINQAHKLLYPFAHHNEVQSIANNLTLDTAIIYSIIRQESRFMHDAKSSAGALGLMQLLPSTAEFFSKKLKISVKHPYALLAIKTNLQLGSTYLKTLLKRFSGNIILSLAAYNAGSGNVKRWLNKWKRTHRLPEADKLEHYALWIETLPFYETREYLKHVLTSIEFYHDRLKYSGHD